MPLLRRMPKRGFNNKAFKKLWGIVNVKELGRFAPGTVIDETLLRRKGLISGRVDGIKVLGDGEISGSVVIRVDAISASARGKIEKAGGVVELTPASGFAQ